MAVTKRSTRMQDDQERIGLLVQDNDNESAGLEIDMVALLYRLVEKLKWLIAAALLGALVFGVYTWKFVTPTYKSTATLYVINPSDAAVDLSYINMGDKLAADYVQVFKNWHVHEMVINSLGLPYSHADIQEMLTINIPSGTRMINITVTSEDPQEARNIAMAYANFAPAFIEAKMETDRPNIFAEPRVPDKPSSPNLKINILLGFLLGGFIAAAVVVLQFIVDDRIRTSEQLERRLGLPVLGMMPIQDAEGKKKRAGKREADE